MTNPFRDFPIIGHGRILNVALEALGEVQLDGFAGFSHTILKKDATPQGRMAWRRSIPPELSDSGTFQRETLEFGLWPLGGFPLWLGQRAGLWVSEAQVHEPGGWNAAFSPLRYGLRADFAYLSDGTSAADRVNYFACFWFHRKN